ncbi:MAG: MerC domain-containing protein [Chitinophagaceae bacterium]|nr:MerC domain-containing protein [Chitinophagaceae bacterium]
MKIKLNWDALGIGTSLLCAIHCALLPAIASTLPVFGINIINNVLFEWGMIIFACLIGCYALIHGFIKHHKNFTPLLIFATGFLFLVSKQVLHGTLPEYWLLSFAVLFITGAHYYNYKLCHQSKCSSPHHKH